MEGIIINFRSSRHRQVGNQMVIVVSGVEDKENAEKLVGKKVVWTTPAKNTISGTVTAAHGNSGAVRARFEKGMPGQSVGQKIKFE